jgi:RimJ/RimL family protein N-acetyltransferase
MAWNCATSLDDARAFLDGWVVRNYLNRELDYALCLRDNPDVVVGGLGVYWRSKEHGVMELGYVLAREHLGHGYMPEAARHLIHHAFSTTNVERIYAPIFAPNEKSRRAAEKMGLRFEGIHRSAIAVRGQRWDEAIYAIIREDILAR